uniref:Haem-binding uptake Tiki superfamily ChaN domain-containing protein n=1 Tax=Oryza punctata TaxID=4537 RepID=A0A0E0JQH6_ORYPU
MAPPIRPAHAIAPNGCGQRETLTLASANHHLVAVVAVMEPTDCPLWIDPSNAFRIVIKCAKYVADLEYGMLEMADQNKQDNLGVSQQIVVWGLDNDTSGEWKLETDKDLEQMMKSKWDVNMLEIGVEVVDKEGYVSIQSAPVDKSNAHCESRPVVATQMVNADPFPVCPTEHAENLEHAAEEPHIPVDWNSLTICGRPEQDGDAHVLVDEAQLKRKTKAKVGRKKIKEACDAQATTPRTRAAAAREPATQTPPQTSQTMSPGPITRSLAASFLDLLQSLSPPSRRRRGLRLRRMLPHAPTPNPAACRFLPLLPPKPLLAPAAAAASSRGGLCVAAASRRDFLLLVPSIAAASTVLQSLPLSASAADDEKQASPPAPAPAPTPAEEPEAEALSRVYDATVIGEPQAVGKDARRRVWEKLMAARVVYLGEAELVPDRDDRVLELEVVRKLAARCAEAGRSISLALEAFPCNLQEQLNQFMDGRIDGNDLRLYTSHWAPERWQEYEPLLNYCRDNGVKLVACGTPLEVSRTVQAEGIRGLSKAQRKLYAPPAGSGFISGFTSISGRSLIDKISSIHGSPFGPSSYLSAQARVVDDYTMSQTIMKEITNGDPSGMLVVVTGSSHVIYGSRGIGVPARISKKMQKKKQVVVLLNPERQGIRREGEIPVADFLWYSAAKPCSRNCFDRAEIARVMNAAGRRREALPQDLQKGIDLGVVSPEILQNFFDLEKYPVMAELIHRFQGFRERLLADPKFLHRLAIEEGISITTTLIAQYEKRKGRFLEEIDYVLTDTIRGSVVDFFTVWLPAPTISLLSLGDDGSGESLELLKGLLGSLPDNAFQKGIMGQSWNTNQRFASVLMGGIKLAGVGFISSIGAGVASDVLYAARRVLRPSTSVETARRRTPIWKSATVYSCFLGTSANLRYQIIAGLVEHRLGEYLMAYYNQPLLASLLSFVSRTINSYWGTQQWIDLARATGLQTSKKELPSPEISNPPDMPLLECGTTEVQNMDDSNRQQPMKFIS